MTETKIILTYVGVSSLPHERVLVLQRQLKRASKQVHDGQMLFWVLIALVQTTSFREHLLPRMIAVESMKKRTAKERAYEYASFARQLKLQLTLCGQISYPQTKATIDNELHAPMRRALAETFAPPKHPTGYDAEWPVFAFRDGTVKVSFLFKASKTNPLVSNWTKRGAMSRLRKREHALRSRAARARLVQASQKLVTSLLNSCLQ